MAEFRVPDSQVDPISHAATAGIIDSTEKMSRFDADLSKKQRWYKHTNIVLKQKQLLTEFSEYACENKKSQSERVIFAVTLTESNTTATEKSSSSPVKDEEPVSIRLYQRNKKVQEACLPSKPKDVRLELLSEESPKKLKIFWTKSENAVQSPYTVTVARSDGTGESLKWTTKPGYNGLVILPSKLHENHEYTASVQANFLANIKRVHDPSLEEPTPSGEDSGEELGRESKSPFPEELTENLEDFTEEEVTESLVVDKKEDPNLIGLSKKAEVKFTLKLRL